MTKLAASFQCDTCSAGIFVKEVIQNVAKDDEQNLVGYSDECKSIVEFYTALKGKIYHQYHDTCDMEWPIRCLLFMAHGF